MTSSRDRVLSMVLTTPKGVADRVGSRQALQLLEQPVGVGPDLVGGFATDNQAMVAHDYGARSLPARSGPVVAEGPLQRLGKQKAWIDGVDPHHLVSQFPLEDRGAVARAAESVDQRRVSVHYEAARNQVVQHRLDRGTAPLLWLNAGSEHGRFELLLSLCGIGAERALQQRLQRSSIQLDDPLGTDCRERVAAGLDEETVAQLHRGVAPAGQYELGVGAVVVGEVEELLERARRAVERRPWPCGGRHGCVVPVVVLSVGANAALLSSSGRRNASITIEPRWARAPMR